MGEVVQIEGVTAAGFEPVRAAFAQNFADGVELGASFALVRDGEVLVNLWAGFADRARTRPFQADTLTPVFSTTKPVAALVIAMLVDRGQLAYDAPVADIWPEFAAVGKGAITLAQALSHQGGLSGFPDPIDPALWLDPPALAAALAALPPLWPPGTASGYHPLTYGYIAGEVVRRAAGETLGTLLRREVCGPLGIDFWIGTPDSEHARCAEMQRPTDLPMLGPITPIKRTAFLTKWSAPDRGGAEWRRAEIPSANGHGTALAVARLYGAFAHHGRVEGLTLFGPDTYAQLTRSRITGDDLVLPYRCDWAAGVMRNANLTFGPNPETLAHSGWGGSCGFGDPATGLSGAYVMNRQQNTLIGDPRARRLIDAVYTCL